MKPSLLLYTIERQVDVSSHVLLDANEHYKQWVNIPTDILKRLHRYPDNSATSLRMTLSQQYCFPFSPNNLFICSGSIEGIDLLIHSLKPDRLYVSTPTYDVYAHRATIHGVTVVRVPFRKDGQPNTSILTKRNNVSDMIVLINPNNPTGDLVKSGTLKRILNDFKGTIVIDEAYIEFAGLDKSLQNFAAKYPNVIILRTFSKAWGLAGVRLGYIIASTEIVKKLKIYQNPYSVNSVAIFAGECALEQKSGLEIEVANTLSRKAILIRKLEKSGVKVKDSSANFITLDIANAHKAYEYLKERRVLTRPRPLIYGGSDCLRITIGSESDLDLFEKLIKEAIYA